MSPKFATPDWAIFVIEMVRLVIDLIDRLAK